MHPCNSRVYACEEKERSHQQNRAPHYSKKNPRTPQHQPLFFLFLFFVQGRGFLRTWFAGCLLFAVADASTMFHVAGGRQHKHAPLTYPLEQVAVHHASKTVNYASAGALEFPQTIPKGREKREVGRRDDGNGDGGNSEPTALHVSGACDRQSGLNTDFTPQGFTADGKPYYKSDDGSRYLYYDKHCDGKEATPGRWIFDSTKPNTTAASDLDEDGECNYSGRADSTTALPPGQATWRLSCGNGWTDVPLTIAEVPTYDGWIVCPPGFSCYGSGCSANSTATSAARLAPRDRWDPKEVSCNIA